MTSLGHLQPYNNGGNVETDPEGHLTLSQKIEAFLGTVNAQQNYLNERGKESQVVDKGRVPPPGQNQHPPLKKSS